MQTTAAATQREEVIERKLAVVRAALEDGCHERAVKQLRCGIDELLDAEATSRRDLSTPLAEICTREEHFRALNLLDTKARVRTVEDLARADMGLLMRLPNIGPMRLCLVYAEVLKWLVGE